MARAGIELSVRAAAEGHRAAAEGQVRKTPSWPRSWADFSLSQLYSHGNAWANLHLASGPTSHPSFLARQRKFEARMDARIAEILAALPLSAAR